MTENKTSKVLASIAVMSGKGRAAPLVVSLVVCGAARNVYNDKDTSSERIDQI